MRHKLTCVHHSQSVLRLKDHPKEPVHSEEVFCAVSKEYTLLRFHMQMRRKEDPEGSEVGQEAGSRENEEIKEGGSKADMKENSEGGDLVIVSMKKTSFCVVRGRGCTDTGGTVNDVVLLAQSSKVTLGEYKLEFSLQFNFKTWRLLNFHDLFLIILYSLQRR